MIVVLLLLVPLGALGLVLGMARLEERLLTAPAAPAPASGSSPAPAPAVVAAPGATSAVAAA